jgi:hypothetical protein
MSFAGPHCGGQCHYPFIPGTVQMRSAEVLVRTPPNSNPEADRSYRGLASGRPNGMTLRGRSEGAKRKRASSRSQLSTHHRWTTRIAGRRECMRHPLLRDRQLARDRSGRARSAPRRSVGIGDPGRGRVLVPFRGASTDPSDPWRPAWTMANSGDGIETEPRWLPVDAGFVEPVDCPCRQRGGMGAGCVGCRPRRLGRGRSTAAGGSADWPWRIGDRERHRVPLGSPTVESPFDAGEYRLHRAWHAEPSALRQNQLELDPILGFSSRGGAQSPRRFRLCNAPATACCAAPDLPRVGFARIVMGL